MGGRGTASASFGATSNETKDGFGFDAIAEWLGMDPADAKQYSKYWANMDSSEIQAEHASPGDLNPPKDQADALILWTGVQSSNIRESQQNGKPSEQANALETLISENPKWYGGETYRGMNGVTDDALKELTTKGATVNMKGLSSWTTSLDVAESFANGSFRRNIVFVAKAQPFGTSIRGASTKPEENEVLVSSKANYQVRNAHFNAEKNIWYVYLDDK